MNIKFNQFNGIIPRISSRLLPDTSATDAENVNLLSKNIDLLHEPSEVQGLVDSSQISLYYYDAPAPNPKTWLTWPYDVDVVKHPSAEDEYNRIYWTGDPSGKIKMETGVADSHVTSSTLPVPVAVTASTSQLFDPSQVTCVCSGNGITTKTLYPASYSKTTSGYSYSWNFPASVDSGNVLSNMQTNINIPNAGTISNGNDANTKLLLHFNNSIVDFSPSNHSVSSTLAYSSSQYKFGGYAADSISATNATVPASSDWLFTGNMTIDFWFVPKSGYGDGIIFAFGHDGIGGSAAPYCYIQSFNSGLGLEFGVIQGGTSSDRVLVSSCVSLDTWTHVAAIREGSSLKLYVNGSLVGTTAFNNTYIGSAIYPARICHLPEVYWGQGYRGYLDELRVSNVARWTSTFTPPTSEYSAVAGSINLVSDTVTVATFTVPGLTGGITGSAYTSAHTVHIQCADPRIPEMENAGFKITVLRPDNIVAIYEIHPPYLEAGHGLDSYWNGAIEELNSTIPGGGFTRTPGVPVNDNVDIIYTGGIIGFAAPDSGYSLYSGGYMDMANAVYDDPFTYTVWNATTLSTDIAVTYNYTDNDYYYVMTYLDASNNQSAASPISARVERDATTRVVLTLPVSSDGNVVNKRIYRRYQANNEFAYYLVATVSNATTSYVDWITDANLNRSYWIGAVDIRDVNLPTPASAITYSTSDLFAEGSITCTWSGSGLTTRTLSRDSLIANDDGYAITWDFPPSFDKITGSATPATPTLTVNIPGIGNVTNSNIGTYYAQTSDGVKWADIQFMGIQGANTYTVKNSFESMEGGTADTTGLTAVSNGAFYITLQTIYGEKKYQVTGCDFTGTGGDLSQIASILDTRLTAAISETSWSVSASGGKLTVTIGAVSSSSIITGIGYFSSPDTGTDISGLTRLDAAYAILGNGYVAVYWDESQFTAQIKMNYEFSREYYYYLMTYVNAYGEESPPSPMSAAVDRTSETRIALTLPVSSDSTIEKKRIYRSATGTSSAGFYFVTEVTNATSSYVDWIKTSALAEKLSVHESPPDGLKGLVLMPNGFAAAFKGREVWFSEPFYLPSWLQENVITIDYDIVGLAVSGNDLVVMTKGSPSLITGDAPEDMRQSKIALPQSCVSKRSIATNDNMVYYASPDGIVQVRGGIGTLITYNYFRRDQWQALNPSTSLAAVYDNRYHLHVDGGENYMFDMNGEGLTITTYDTGKAQGIYVDIETDTMYYIYADKIMSWDTSSTALTGIWRSKVFLFDRPQVFTSAQVSARTYTNIIFRAWAGGTLIVEQPIYNGESIRIPAGRTEREWQFEIETDDIIDDIQISSSMITMQ